MGSPRDCKGHPLGKEWSIRGSTYLHLGPLKKEDLCRLLLLVSISVVGKDWDGLSMDSKESVPPILHKVTYRKASLRAPELQVTPIAGYTA